MKIIFLEEFGKAFIPKKIRPRLRIYLLKAGIDEVPYKFFGGLFYVSLILTYILYISFIMPWLEGFFGNLFMLIFMTFFAWVAVQMAIVGVIMLTVYSYLDIIIFNRTKRMEEVLPDFLRYVSENLRGGMSFDKAIWAAIRPEYGVLADEVSLIAKKSMSGLDLEDAIMDFTDKYDSPLMKRIFNLIVEGMKGGSPLADLIERVQNDLVDTVNLKEEMSAANTTYVIFLGAITMFIAPGLFGLSFNLLLVLQQVGSTLSSTTASNTNMPFQFGSIALNTNGFKTFSVISLTVISVFVSMIISIIRKGNIKQGLKYIPILTIVSIIMYFIFRSAFEAMFSGIAGGL